MAQPIEVREGYHIEHPNRESASAKATKAVVVLLLLVSTGLLVIIAVGGWSKMAGAQPILIGYILLYLLMAYYVLRWNRGVLTMCAALAMILGIFAAIAGPEWFSRDKPGFTSPTLDESVLGLLTLLLVPVQILQIAFSMRGFQQAWNVEVEVRDGEHYRPGEFHGDDDGPAHREPAPA